jgi:hypothetical protein
VWLRDVPEAGLTAADLAATVDTIEACQLPSGMIPWFPGGHADPWNHTEAAMALVVGGRRARADLAFEWLATRQRPDGAWHRYELADGIEEDKLDANVCAYPATGMWHHWLCHRDRGFLDAFWPMMERAIDFVLGLQTPRGEILWARHADGTPWPFALLTGSSSISLSLRCALAVASELGHERARWADAADRLDHTLANVPDAFVPKARWAMDWYYPALVGVLEPDVARARLAQGWDRFVGEGQGVRCVTDQDWFTAAETCECALAHLRNGEPDRATDLLRWAQQLRDRATGQYCTGFVLPQDVHFPEDERSTYTGAAVVLCADAIAAGSPASGLFVDPAVVRGRAGELR